MPHRRFMLAWIVGLVILIALAAWLAFGPALSNRSRAAAAFQQASAGGAPSASGKVPVQVGISVEKISDFSVKNVAWDADFYVWFRWTQPADDPQFDPANTFEIASGTITQKQRVAEQVSGDQHYVLERVSASINFPFDVTRYPVDDHLLRLYILDPVHPDVRYVADTQNSRVAPSIGIPGYRIARTIIGTESIDEGTNLGDPSKPKTSARFGFSIFILRQGLGFYLKLFQALFAAVGVALLSGFFKAHEEIRIELLVGGFFAAVANSYITSTYLPDTGSMTLMDTINLLGLVTIFLCMIQTVISGRFANRGETEFSRKFDRVSFGLIAVAYLFLNLALPLAAQIR